MTILITKADGEQEPFVEEKLERSLIRAGATKDIARNITDQIVANLRDGQTTQEIYERAFEMLRAEDTAHIAARYSVKRAILDLGPSGFPFEQFVASILESLGYEDVHTGVALQGKCAPHEVDITARHNNNRTIAELKFHNSLGVKTDLKVALYVKARFDDLRTAHKDINEGWLITNTRFTRNAIRYASCAKLHLLGWNYPHKRGLEALLDEAGVHPITALTTITDEQKREMLDRNIVLCRHIKLDDQSLHSYHISPDAFTKVRKEINALCHTTYGEPNEHVVQQHHQNETLAEHVHHDNTQYAPQVTTPHDSRTIE